MTADWLGLSILIAVTALLLARGLSSPNGVLQFPFLAAAVVAGWFIPQAIGVADDPTLPQTGYIFTMLYAACCMIAVLAADRRRVTRPANVPQYNYNKLLIAAAVLSFLGGAAFTQTLSTPAQFNEQGLTTGIVTVWYFFSKLQYFGLAIALFVLLRRWSLPALALVIFDLNMVMGFILFGGRRGPAVEVATIVLTAFWFRKRWVPPRWVIVAGVIFASVFGNSIGEYRSLVTQINQNSAEDAGRLPTVDEIMNINFVEDFSRMIEHGSYEARNAVYSISAANEALIFDFGIQYWNYFLFSYVPAQFVGADVKSALTVDLPNLPLQEYDYIPHLGTTETGFADSYENFAIFGVFVFAGIALMMHRWWKRAVAGALDAMLFYAISLSTALHAITHSTQWLIVFLPYLYGTLLPVLYWAKENRRTHRTVRIGELSGGAYLACSSPGEPRPGAKPVEGV